MESLGEEREGILLSEVEVGIARQHITTAVEKRRSDFVTRCQLLADRLFADLLRYRMGVRSRGLRYGLILLLHAWRAARHKTN